MEGSKSDGKGPALSTAPSATKVNRCEVDRGALHQAATPWWERDRSVHSQDHHIHEAGAKLFSIGACLLYTFRASNFRPLRVSYMLTHTSVLSPCPYLVVCRASCVVCRDRTIHSIYAIHSRCRRLLHEEELRQYPRAVLAFPIFARLLYEIHYCLSMWL